VQVNIIWCGHTFLHALVSGVKYWGKKWKEVYVRSFFTLYTIEYSRKNQLAAVL